MAKNRDEKLTSYTLEGWVIVPPLSPWDVQHKDKIWPEMSYSSFGKTAAEAWRRHVRTSIDDSSLNETGEFSRRVQFWHDRGYRAKTAKLEIFDGE